MYQNQKILAVIPARGGSKGVPRKNVRLLDGKPLILYSVDQARGSRYIDRTVVTSDDEGILKLIGQTGCCVEILHRPPELATDACKMLPVLQHAVDSVEKQKGEKFSTIVLLQPTSPLRSSGDIDRSIEILWEHPPADSVLGFIEAQSLHPVRFKKIVDGYVEHYGVIEQEGTNRQDREPAYLRNGAIYTYRRETLMNKNSIWGERIRPYLMPEERSVEIDSELDFQFAEFLVKHLKTGMSFQS